MGDFYCESALRYIKKKLKRKNFKFCEELKVIKDMKWKTLFKQNYFNFINVLVFMIVLFFSVIFRK